MMGKSNVEVRTWFMTDIDNFRQLLQYFVAHLEFCEANPKGSSTLIKTRGYDDYIVNNNDFKRTGKGYNDDDIQKQIASWEDYSTSKICITVSNRNSEGTYKNHKQNYLQWKGTDNDIRASWDTNKITELVISTGEKKIRTLDVTDNLYDKAGHPVTNNTDKLKDFWNAFDKLRPVPQDSITNQIGDVLNLKSVNPNTQYWRLNIDPDKWDIRNVKIGAEESFVTRSENNRNLPHYKSAKKDDVVLGYETKSQVIVSLLVVSQPDNGQEIYFKKILDVNPDFLTREEIIKNQKTKDALTPPQTTFIPVPTEKFVEIISMMIKKGVLGKRAHPLNLILYGPPGTGKTYNTLFHALAIINNTDVKKLQKGVEDGTLKYDDLKKEYDTYVKSGQIDFTTFHQSMSYEDFIEGIKPIPDKINIEAEYKNNTKSKSTLFGDGTTTIKNLSRMKYEVKDGIFKQICKDAEKSREISHKIVLKDVIDYFCYDYEKFGSQTEVTRGTKIFRISTLNVKKDGSYKSIELTSGTENQSIQLDVIRRDYGDFITGKITSYKDIKPSRISKSTVYGNSELCFGLLQKIKDFEDNRYPQYTSGTLNTEVTGKQNYVLIIDEINRGNVAQIFGELITLIEPSKRLGNSEEMKAILPYSSAQKGNPVYFGVPNNLYIIGTMNTADRSVEALDTALRRRFSFEEMMPKPKLLGDKELCDVKLNDLLTTINQRIVALKDREHQIGHSYFMGLETESDLKDVFKDKIIPLLQEYFYGDYKKIYYVLGPGFVKEIPENENKPEDIFPVKTDDDIDIDGSMTRYIIKSFEEGDDKINIKAAVNRLIKSKSDEDNLRTELKGIKFKEAIIDENGNEKERVISIDEVVERLLCGENRSKFNEEKITDLPNPNPR